MLRQAFDSGTAAGLQPNKTLAAYVKGKDKKEGTNVMVRGFWADVVSGPFFAHGAHAVFQEAAAAAAAAATVAAAAAAAAAASVSPWM
ncbi:hypothetical protein Emag_004752 [Eimeria magna]